MLYLYHKKVMFYENDGVVYHPDLMDRAVDVIKCKCQFRGDIYLGLNRYGVIVQHALDDLSRDRSFVSDDGTLAVDDDERMSDSAFGKVSDIMELLRDIFNSSGIYYNIADDERVFRLLDDNMGLDGIEARMLALYAPTIPSDQVGKVSVYMNVADRRRDRRTTIKIGRFVRLIRSAVNDKTVEIISNKFKIKFTPRDFTLHVGSSRPAFRYAYKGVRCEYQDPRTTSMRKALATSCMHTVSCDSDGTSPAEVYASGDFHVAWVTTLEDGKERLGGRVVIRNAIDDNPPVHAPLYGACEASLDKLQEYLDNIGATSDGDWEGAKLLRLEGDCGIIAPYSDMDGCVDDYGTHLEFSSCGEYELSSTDGFIAQGEYCQHCEERFDYENEGGYVDGCGPTCQHCLDDSYVWIDSEDSYVDIDYAVEVHYRHKRYDGTSVTWTRWEHERCPDIVWCECEEEYWYEDDVSYSYNMNDSVPTHLIDNYPDFYEQNEEEAA